MYLGINKTSIYTHLSFCALILGLFKKYYVATKLLFLPFFPRRRKNYMSLLSESPHTGNSPCGDFNISLIVFPPSVSIYVVTFPVYMHYRYFLRVLLLLIHDYHLCHNRRSISPLCFYPILSPHFVSCIYFAPFPIMGFPNHTERGRVIFGLFDLHNRPSSTLRTSPFSKILVFIANRCQI